jgi:hypothetical protein
MVNWLLISTLVLTGFSSLDSRDQSGCESLVIEVRTSGQGTLVLTYADHIRKADLVLHLFTNGGVSNRLNMTALGEITGVKPGKYVLVIVDKSSRYCPMKVEIEITP